MCLIVDLQMPDMNGLELHQHLISRGMDIPTILITAHADAALQGQSQKRCVNDENRARQQLASQWSKFSPASKAQCIPLESIGVRQAT
ncbi:response regulator [Bradyrhizobium sp. RDI18]|uniref:response regulator n=1 Tax=Bradyrhizobium sp. RDI18 TaxID=3367400 RepID=UPI003723490B